MARQPLHELGLDSLMAVEFRNCLSAATGRPMPVTLLFSCPAIDDITEYLADLLFPAEKKEEVAAASAPVGLPASVRTLDAVEELSDEEVDRLLAANATIEGAANGIPETTRRHVAQTARVAGA